MLKFSTYLKDLRAVAMINAMNGGSVLLFDGIQPQMGASASNHTLIATLRLANPCANVSNGVITFNATNAVKITQDATVTWARILDTNNVFLMDLSCGGADSQADLIFSDNELKQDGIVSISGAQISENN